MTRLAVIAWLLLALPCWASYQDEPITLRQYIDIRIDAVEAARIVAYQSMEKRLEGMNEFRDTLKDQAALFVTRRELDPLQDDIRTLRENAALMQGKASQASMYLAAGSAIAGILISLATLIATFVYRGKKTE
jgi:hypothetical protein